MTLNTFARNIITQLGSDSIWYTICSMAPMVNPPLLQTIGYQPQEAADLAFRMTTLVTCHHFLSQYLRHILASTLAGKEDHRLPHRQLGTDTAKA